MKFFAGLIAGLCLVALAYLFLFVGTHDSSAVQVQPVGQPVNGPVQDLSPVQPTPLPAPVVVTPVTVEVEVIREVQVVVTATPVPIVLPTLKVVEGSSPGGTSGGGK